MNEFSYCSYESRYSSNKLGIGLCSRPCFREVFDRDIDKDEKVDYTIIVYKGLNHQKKTSRHNGCFLSPKQIRNYLNIAKNICKEDCKFDFRIKNSKKKDHLELNVIITGRLLYHKYLLTWIRYIYEFPYNVLLNDSYLIRKTIPKYRFTSISNLILLTFSGCPDIGLGHSVSVDGKMLTNEELRKRLRDLSKERKYPSLNDIYRSVDDGTEKFKYRYSDISDSRFNDIEFWRNNDILKERMNIYNSNYNKLKI